MSLVDSVQCLPRVHSDHSPMSLHLNLGVRQGIRHWRMEVNWLQEYVKIKYTQAIGHYWMENGASGSSLLQWEASKATLRGVFIMVPASSASWLPWRWRERRWFLLLRLCTCRSLPRVG